MTTATYDALALSIMLSDLPAAEREAQLTALRGEADEAIGAGHECRFCGSLDIEDNGCTGSHLVYACCSCGEQFGPGTQS